VATSSCTCDFFTTDTVVYRVHLLLVVVFVVQDTLPSGPLGTLNLDTVLAAIKQVDALARERTSASAIVPVLMTTLRR
jgi:hypothetical protein